MGASRFPITFWCGVPPEYSSAGRYREVADAGFNIAQVAGSREQIREALDYCAEVGIAGMPIDNRMPHAGHLEGGRMEGGRSPLW